jgi:hypothetical protein
VGAQQEHIALCEKFLQKIVNNQIKEAFDFIKPHSQIPESEVDKLALQTLKQLELVKPRFGNILGFEFLKEEIIKQTFARYTFFIKYQKTVVRWIFLFYKPQDTWGINAISWDDKIQALFSIVPD